MSKLILTNISTYKDIAIDAFESMQTVIESAHKPKNDGTQGWIIQFDSNQTSFKLAMIVIVFAGMWLEALLHLLIVRDHGENKFREFDFKPYEEKLKLLGITNQSVLEDAGRFRKARKELVHEKAYSDSSETKMAQNEAHNAHQLLLTIESELVGHNN